MTMQETVAANVRARLAWSKVSHDEAAQTAGCSARSFRNKVAGKYPFRPDELGRLAPLLGVDDVGAFFRVPEGFATSGSSSAWIRRVAGQQRHLRLVAA